MEVFNLDIIPGKSAPVIHASQFDAGREFKANLFEGPTVYTLSGAETLSVIVRKPDGNMVTAAVTNTSDSYITFETTEQMTACDGANLCELRIENGADVIGSINFIMEVEKSPDTGITSASEIHNLEAQVDAFTAIAVANQYDSANVIFDNSPTPGHGNGYAVTSEGVATALSTKADTSSVPTQLDDLSDTTITTPSSGQVLAYDGSKWVNGNNIQYISLGGNSTATVNCGYGSIIFMARNSISRHCLYMIDGWGAIETFIESNADLSLSYSDGVLTITNTTSSGRSITVLKA